MLIGANVVDGMMIVRGSKNGKTSSRRGAAGPGGHIPVSPGAASPIQFINVLICTNIVNCMADVARGVTGKARATCGRTTGRSSDVAIGPCTRVVVEVQLVDVQVCALVISCNGACDAVLKSCELAVASSQGRSCHCGKIVIHPSTSRPLQLVDMLIRSQVVHSFTCAGSAFGEGAGAGGQDVAGCCGDVSVAPGATVPVQLVNVLVGADIVHGLGRPSIRYDGQTAVARRQATSGAGGYVARLPNPPI